MDRSTIVKWKLDLKVTSPYYRDFLVEDISNSGINDNHRRVKGTVFSVSHASV